MADSQASFAGGRIAGIDPLRGAAALAVVVCHIGGHFWNFTWQSPGPEKVFGWLGYWGVSLFFVISGFCIRLPMARARLADPGARLDVGEFALHRFLRIAPPYWAAMAASIAAGLFMRTELLDGAHGALDLALHVVGLHTLWPSTFSSINGVFWTIGIEAHFYAAYLLLANRRIDWRIVAGLLLLALVTFAGVSTLLHGAWRPVGQTLFITSFWQWCLGAMLADWQASRQPEARSGRLWAGRLALLLFSLAFGLVDPRLYGFRLATWLMPFAATGLVAAFVVRPAGAEQVGALSRTFAWLGRISFSLYLFHPVILSMAAFAVAAGWLSNGSAAVIELLGSVLIAALAYWFIERPTLLWLSRRPATVMWSLRPTEPA